MKKTKKAIISLSLAVILTLSTVACSAQEDAPPAIENSDPSSGELTQDHDSTTTTVTAEEDAAETTATVPGEAEPAATTTPPASTTSAPGTNLPTVTSTQNTKPAMTTHSGSSPAVTTTTGRPSPTPAVTATPAPSVTTAPPPAVTTKPIPGHTHSYTSAVLLEASCDREGIISYVCSCGDTYYEYPAPTGHNYSATDTIHHDAEYGTRDKIETWLHITYYECLYLDLLSIDSPVCNSTYLKYTAPDDKDCADGVSHYLYDAIVNHRVGNMKEMLEYDPLFASVYSDDADAKAFLITSREYYYNEADPNGTLEVLYLYSPMEPFYDAISDFSGYQHTVYPVDDLIAADRARQREMSVAEYGNDHYPYKFPTFIPYNWTEIQAGERTERVVGTETYVVRPAYDETVYTCSKCGSTYSR